MSEDRNTDRNSIQVISRAAQVLRLLAEQDNGLTLTEIARETDLARSTIQRIVKALGDEDFLMPSPDGSGVVLGPGLIKLTSAKLLDVTSIVRPLLQKLAAEVDETVDLSMLKGDAALFVEHIAGSHRLAALSSVGTEFPLYSTANGKALLGCLEPVVRGALLTPPFARDTEATLSTVAELDRQLAAISQTGIAFDLEEHTEGVCAVGTAFLDALGRAYAISIPVPRQRFDQKREILVAPLLDCRRAVIAKIGGSLPAGVQ